MSYQKAFDTACRILTRRSCSVKTLRDRLSSKGFTEEIVDQVIARLLELGYLNDRNYAYNYSVSVLKSRSMGRARLGRRLREKQVADEDVNSALEELYSGDLESELCDRAIAKHTRIHGIPQDYVQSRKLVAHLIRLGFPLDMIRSKMCGLREEDLNDT